MNVNKFKAATSKVGGARKEEKPFEIASNLMRAMTRGKNPWTADQAKKALDSEYEH